MKVLILLSMIISTQAFATAQTMGCRDAVVMAKNALGEKISPESFSSNKFSDFNMTVEIFNNMSSEMQAEIYMLIKPLEVMVEEVRAEISGNIEYMNNSRYRFFYVDDIAAFQDVKDTLDACELE